MDKQRLNDLQSRFKCLKCGRCCVMGGDMVIHLEDINRIIDVFGWARDREKLKLFIPVEGTDDDFILAETHPCKFFDVSRCDCSIYDVRPASCKIYPFGLFAAGRCKISAIEICPSALMQLVRELA